MSSPDPGNAQLRGAQQRLGLRSQPPITDLGLTAPSADDAPRPPGKHRVSRRTFVSMASGLGVGAVTQVPARASGTVRPPVRYAFEDEFGGPAGGAPDPSKWGYDLGGGGWGNNELEVYTSARANSFLDGEGHLVIRAIKSAQTSGGQTTTTYQSARLNTAGKFSQYQGIFEARIKLDVQPGLWPAWWAVGANFGQVGWPACGEVDMLENFGGSTVRTSVHTPDDPGTGVFTKDTAIAVDDGWHTWRMSWNPGTEGFTFCKDGVTYMTVAPTQMANWCFSSGVPVSMVLNLAVGGIAGTPPDTVQFPVTMLVDYVRVW